MSSYWNCNLEAVNSNPVLIAGSSPGGGDSHLKQTGMLVGNFEFNP